MKKQLYRLTKPFLLMAFSILFITACYHPAIQKNHLSLKPSPECRIIQHELGETCIPSKPQRIVTLAPEHNLDPLIALGVKPIGFTSYNIPNKGKQSLFGASLDAVAGAKYVGNVYQPSLEKILMVKPDLILDCCKPPHYKLLSAIAPTVVVPDSYNVSANQAFFKENLRYIAKLLGRETRAEEVLSQYQKRIEELKQRLGNQLEQIEVSAIFYGEDLIWTISDRIESLIPAIFNDLGLHYKFLSRDGDLEPKLSIEALGEYDADIVFIVNVGEKPSSFYFQHPLFSRLKAVKNNRAYVVDQETWGTAGILGANKILDDLEKYLVSLSRSHD